MRIGLVLLATPFLLYGAAKGYLWHEVKSNADELVQAASPFAKISYDSVHTSLLGDEIGLDNISIKPVMTQDEFRIEQVRISAPHIGYFIGAGDNVKKGQPPENLAMQIRRMHIDMDSELFTMLEQMQQQAALAQTNETDMWLTSLDALGCGDISSFAISDYLEMGFANIVADASINMAYDEQSKRTLIKVETHTDNLYDIGIGLDFNVTPQTMGSALLANSIPKTTIRYRDTGYYQLRNNYCAKQNESSVEEYVDHHLNLFSTKLGAALPEQTVSAYKQFMLKGGTFIIGLNPSNEQSLEGLQYYAPADIIDMLGLSLTINNTKLDTDLIQWGNKPKKVTVRPDTLEAKPKVVREDRLRPTITPTQGKEKQRRTAPPFQKINVDDAGKYIGKMAEVTTTEGKLRSGMLESVTDERINIELAFRTGSLSIPIDIRKIDDIRVR